MAEIGHELHRIFGKNTVTTYIIGFVYSLLSTISSMLVVILAIVFTGRVVGFNKLGYIDRELFSCTVLYIFIFSLLVTSILNSVLSRYMSDVIYEERLDDILPCYYLGLFINSIIGGLIGIPFCLHEHFVGGVPIYYVFTGYCGFFALMITFYSMLYLSICKDYKRISLFFILGMVLMFVLSIIFVYILKMSVGYSMLLGMTIGLMTTAFLEYATVKKYFKYNSHSYKRILHYFRKYWELIVTNFLYTLGLYVHNFVFWNTSLKIVIVKSFVCAPEYDLATCCAMFTNITATVIFTSRVEMYFHIRYRSYSEAITGGRGMDIENTKNRMFQQLSSELMGLIRNQFSITVVLYLIFVIMLPRFGLSGMVMQIYSCLTAGYFILFTMYSCIIILYYLNDYTGALILAIGFCSVTFLASIFSSKLTPIWYGLGMTIGSFVGWTIAYFRFRWLERNMSAHIFCSGSLLKKGKGVLQSEKVYDVSALENVSEERWLDG